MWALVHEGAYVDHTGPLTWAQRAWAAVLFAQPAALTAVDGSLTVRPFRWLRCEVAQRPSLETPERTQGLEYDGSITALHTSPGFEARR